MRSSLLALDSPRASRACLSVEVPCGNGMSMRPRVEWEHCVSGAMTVTSKSMAKPIATIGAEEISVIADVESELANAFSSSDAELLARCARELL